ncbi:structural protein [Paracoccus phage vB_PmaP_KLEP18-1]|nr:structural protein [Paracoccus phage vB_PmaP_KLEP18-1]
MNPLLIFKTIRDLSALIEEANRLAGPGRRWSLVYTNRSFIAAVLAFVAGIALMIGLPFPLPLDVTAETVYAVITVAGLVWAGVERVLGRTRAVWNRTQAVEAVTEADALTAALRKAGAPVE